MSITFINSVTIYFRPALAWREADPSAKDIYFLDSCRRAGGVRRDVNMAKQSIMCQTVIYENKILQFYNLLNYLSAIILIVSDNIDYCRAVKIGSFFHFSQHSITLTEEIYLTFDILQ